MKDLFNKIDSKNVYKYVGTILGEFNSNELSKSEVIELINKHNYLPVEWNRGLVSHLDMRYGWYIDEVGIYYFGSPEHELVFMEM